jgi:hypothetical protein
MEPRLALVERFGDIPALTGEAITPGVSPGFFCGNEMRETVR